MSKWISWDDQQAFLAVLEEGSLSGAARRLGLSQPTARARIEALEAALGTTLFVRSPGGLVPTREGASLGDSARAMARASDAFVRNATAGEDVSGIVRLGVSEFVGVEVLPRMLLGLRERHPDLVLEIALANTDAALMEQEVDVALRMHPPRESALIARKAGAIPLGLFAHEAYLARRGTPATRADLAAHDLIGADRSRADLDLTEALLPELPRSRFVVRTDSHPAQFAAARAGLGIAAGQVPVGAADPVLRRVLPDLSLGTLDIWIVTHENLRRMPRIDAVIRHLANEIEAYVKSGMD